LPLWATLGSSAPDINPHGVAALREWIDFEVRATPTLTYKQRSENNDSNPMITTCGGRNPVGVCEVPRDLKVAQSGNLGLWVETALR